MKKLINRFVIAGLVLSTATLPMPNTLAKEAESTETGRVVFSDTLTPSNPVKFNISSTSDSRIANSLSVVPNRDGKGAHIQMSLITESPNESRERKVSLGSYSEPVRVDYAKGTEPEQLLNNPENLNSNGGSGRFQTKCSGWLPYDYYAPCEAAGEENCACQNCSFWFDGEFVTSCTICEVTHGTDDQENPIIQHVDDCHYFDPPAVVSTVAVPVQSELNKDLAVLSP